MEHFFFNTTRNSKGGFTMLEMIVVVAIFMILTAVIMTNSAGFTSTFLLNNLAYEVAISIREAQAYGIHGLVDSEVGNYARRESTAGVRFQENTPTSYQVFIDMDNDGVYDREEELEETYTLQRGLIIKKICLMRTNGNLLCSDEGGWNMGVDISFERPKMYALFRLRRDGSFQGGSFSTAYIHIGDIRSEREGVVVVNSLGQIYVE